MKSIFSAVLMSLTCAFAWAGDSYVYWQASCPKSDFAYATISQGGMQLEVCDENGGTGSPRVYPATAGDRETGPVYSKLVDAAATGDLIVELWSSNDGLVGSNVVSYASWLDHAYSDLATAGAAPLAVIVAVPIVAAPVSLDNATLVVYTNGVISSETSEGSGLWRAWSNETAYVVYTAEDGYLFADGSTVCTNTLDTTKNPATAVAPDAPVFAVARIVETGVRYVTVQAAVNAAAIGQTVQMLTNATENVTVAADQTNTLDLAGWVLKGTKGAREDDPVVTVSAGAGLSVTDSVPTTVHNFQVDENGRWVFTNLVKTVDFENLAARPASGAVVAVKGGAITGKGDNTSYARGISVDEGGVLKLTGGNVIGNTGSYGGGIGIYAGTFVMTGGTVCGNRGNISGGGIYGNGACQLTIAGGDVAYNASGAGGGICNESGRLDMVGGKVRSNLTKNGSGGGIYNKDVMYLTGGTVSDNTAKYGGGVCNSKTLTIDGTVVIANNTANEKGGGVYNAVPMPLFSVPGADLTMTGGVISANRSANGGGVSFGKSVTLGGTAVIADNTLLDDVTANNLELLADKTVTLDGLTEGAKIGVTTETAPAAYAPVDITSNGAATDLAYFTSDNPAYLVRFETDHLILSVPDISFVPSPVDRATPTVYTNDAPMATAETYVMPSNATAIVVYTADDGYFFADGSTVCTNTLDTARDPATSADTPAAPAKPSVKVGRPAQRYPWNGIVDVPYRLKNWPAGGAGRQVKFTVTVDKTTLDGGTVAPAAGGLVTGTHAIDFKTLKLPTERGVSTVKAEIVTE